jgi:hypothetical protein
MKASHFVTIFSAVTFVFSACKLIDPAEEIPSYINISSVELSTNSTEGTASHKITDAWIYVDGKLLGAYEIPCTVPVLAEGNHTIIVLPGIKENGMSSLRAIYPFYKGWETTVDLRRGAVDTLAPSFTYFPATNFEWNCTFSGNASNFNPDTVTLLSIVSPPEAFEGNSGRVDLSPAHSFFHGESSSSFLLDPSQEIYLECNYKCTQPFVVGLKNTDDPASQTIQCLVVASSESWNKIYVRLNDALYGYPSGHYKVVIEMSNPIGQPSSTLWLDNLKLLN